jgi:hypothetical protein
MRFKDSLDPRLVRFRNVLLAALQTDYYPPRLEAARLATPKAVAELRTVEEGLARLPAIDRCELLDHRESFHNHAIRVSAGQLPEQLELFPTGWRLFSSRPQVISGPLAALERLASDVRCGVASVPPGAHRILVHSRIDGPLLDDPARESLWRAFGLPIFEQVQGLDGELLAWECEAHNGLHVNAGCALVEAGDGGKLLLTSLAGLTYPILRLETGLIARQAQGLCGCGEKSERLVFTAAIPRKPPLMERGALDMGYRDSLAR